MDCGSDNSSIKLDYQDIRGKKIPHEQTIGFFGHSFIQSIFYLTKS